MGGRGAVDYHLPLTRRRRPQLSVDRRVRSQRRRRSITSTTIARCARGDLLLIDAGCEYGFYASDVTRTFPVGTRFTPLQRDALRSRARRAANADRGDQAGNAIRRSARSRAAGAGRRDVPPRACSRGRSRTRCATAPIAATTCIAPATGWGWTCTTWGFTALAAVARARARDGADGRAGDLCRARRRRCAPEEFRGIGIRIEDDVLVTSDGHEVMTAAMPKAVADVEALTTSA